MGDEIRGSFTDSYVIVEYALFATHLSFAQEVAERTPGKLASAIHTLSESGSQAHAVALCEAMLPSERLVVKAMRHGHYSEVIPLSASPGTVPGSVFSATWLSASPGTLLKRRIQYFMAELSGIINIASNIAFVKQMWEYFQEFNPYVDVGIFSCTVSIIVLLYFATVRGFKGLFLRTCYETASFSSGPTFLLHLPLFSLAAVWVLPLGVIESEGLLKSSGRTVCVLLDDVPSLVNAALFLHYEEFSWFGLGSATMSGLSLMREIASLTSTFASSHEYLPLRQTPH